MSLIQQLTERRQQRTLKQIQKRFDKLQNAKGKRPRSRLKQWLLAADQVERRNKRVHLGLVALIVLLPTGWILLTLLNVELPNYSMPLASKEAAPASVATPPPIPVKQRFQVQLQLQQDLPETAEIIDKIRQRPLPIKITPAPQQGENVLLLTDDTPTTRKDAERLREIYTQLFGVEGKIIETAGDASI